MIAVGLGAQSGFAMICAGGETSAKTNAALITNPRVTYALPVVLRGAVDLFGAKVGQVVAYRWTERQWQEAPIQIDEVNAQGDYVLENGLPFTAGTGDGLYNGNDVNVVVNDEDLFRFHGVVVLRVHFVIIS